MDIFQTLTPSLLLVALAPVTMALAYLYSHRKAPPWVRWAVVAPAFSLCGIFVLFELFPEHIPADVRLFFSRWAITVLFLFLSIVLVRTKAWHG
jgi:hypothetical protein